MDGGLRERAGCHFNHSSAGVLEEYKGVLKKQTQCLVTRCMTACYDSIMPAFRPLPRAVAHRGEQADDGHQDDPESDNRRDEPDRTICECASHAPQPSTTRTPAAICQQSPMTKSYQNCKKPSRYFI